MYYKYLLMVMTRPNIKMKVDQRVKLDGLKANHYFTTTI